MFVVLPPKRSQEDSSRTTRANKSGAKRVAYFLLLEYILCSSSPCHPSLHYKLSTNELRWAKAVARKATCTKPSRLISTRAVGQPIYSSPAACTICIVCPCSAAASALAEARPITANNERASCPN